MDIKTAEKKSSPIIDKNIFTEGLSEPNKKPSNTAKKVEFLLGDPEKTLKEADIVLDRKYSTQTVHQGYIEPHACAQVTLKIIKQQFGALVKVHSWLELIPQIVRLRNIKNKGHSCRDRRRFWGKTRFTLSH